MSELEHNGLKTRKDQYADSFAAAPAGQAADMLGEDIVVESFRLCVRQLHEPLVAPYEMLAVCDRSGRQLAFHVRDGAQNADFRLAENGSFFQLGRNAAAAALETLTEAVVSFREHDAAFLADCQTCAAPVGLSDEGPYGALMLLSKSGDVSRDRLLRELRHVLAVFRCCLQIVMERKKSRELAVLQEYSSNLAHKKDMLFQAAQKLNSLIGVEHVLTETIEHVKKWYPDMQADLFLTQDSRSSKLPVKLLHFSSSKDDICTRAFMEGRLIYEQSERAVGPVTSFSSSTIAAPLSGKQGVYGVLRLQMKDDALDTTDIQFITMLADAAGSAFENAILYEQSNLLVGELRLINAITKRLNQSLRLNEIFHFAMTELLHIFDADFCCLLQLDKEKGKFVVQASNLSALYNEHIEVDYGFTGIVFSTREPIIISDYRTNPKVKSQLMETTNSRSLIASPILMNGEVVGVILIADRKPHYFSYDNYKLLQVLSGQVGLAITNASLHSEVRRMVITDNLTGLYARHYLDEQVTSYQKKDFCGSLILVDIDHFKRVNDTYGHQIGDKILLQVCQVIKTCIRETDIAARWGGEELAVYLPQVTIEQTVRIAERIRTRVLTETSPQVTVSCGISDWSWQDDKISVESLFYKADMALYEAKNNGRNQVKIG